MSAWIVSLPCTRSQAERIEALVDTLPAPQPAIAASEEDEGRGRWRLDAYYPDRPGARALAALAALVPDSRATAPRRLDDRDWVVESQAGLEPVTAGRFVLVTDEGQRVEDSRWRFVIPATVAFGTGHHETTAGCLAMLDGLARTGRRFGRIADIGSGTGLLAFASHRLWPTARVVASDIDPAAVRVAAELAVRNGVPLGSGPGRLRLVRAAGGAHPVIRSGAPYDLVLANILAGPLIDLMPDFATLLADGGTLILAGLTRDQQDRVTRAARRAGLRLVAAPRRGRWPTLRLIKRAGARRLSATPGGPGFGDW